MDIRPLIAVLGALLLAMPAGAGETSDLIQRVRAWRAGQEKAILEELVSFLAIPNHAADGPNIERNAAAISAMLAKRGIEPRLLRHGEAPPAVVGELRAPAAAQTITFYAHYDGQPVDPASWSSDPFKPVVRARSSDGTETTITWREAKKIDPEWRIQARSASDDKAPIVAMLVALDALRSLGIRPQVNIRFFFEGEEEAGSPNLERILQTHEDELRTDAWILSDGPVHQTRRRQVVFGVRGVQGMSITTYGANRGLHSGHYGNWAPNPISLLTHLIASMRDIEGNILIDGFYDDVRLPTSGELDAVRASPQIDEALKRELGLARSEGNGARLDERILLPALNLRGIASGSVGERAANVINPTATASIDFRLVPDQTPAALKERVEAHIRDKGFFVTAETPDHAMRRAHPKIARVTWDSGYAPARTPMDLPLSRSVISIVRSISPEGIVITPSLGGSIPMYLFRRNDTPVVAVPMVNHDNNQHAADENLRIQNLWEGIETFAALFAELR
ncbi:MAG TPA: M20/M25/M40 family metallo-hydrolase [Thermoanaerobaculia bacterium]|nr:M20/M25/M40 family metallo-hydrolase [Thermoanaerobaculia bacterium]